MFILYLFLCILSIGSHLFGLLRARFLFSVQPNTALFEACCNEKIQQFDDSGSDEEVSVNSRVHSPCTNELAWNYMPLVCYCP